MLLIISEATLALRQTQNTVCRYQNERLRAVVPNVLT